MSSSLIYVHPSSNRDDASFAASIEAALKKQRQPGWHDIYIAVRNGVVTLNGEVTTNRDRQFVLAVTRQVVGTARILDKLTVVDKRTSNTNSDAETESSLADKLRARFKSGKRVDHFKHLPVTSNSLEDLSAQFLKDRPTQF
jgi:osmotically-inducible protein OsmY